MEEPVRDVVMGLALVVMFLGLIGIALPMLPGTILIFGAALVYAVLDKFQAVDWPTVIVLGVLAAAATSAEMWATSVGAKAGGASGWSVLAGLAGGLVGLIFFSLPGSIIGALLGVVVVEVLRVRDWEKVFKAGGGWILGWLLSVVLQLSIGLAMIAIFIWQATGAR